MVKNNLNYADLSDVLEPESDLNVSIWLDGLTECLWGLFSDGSSLPLVCYGESSYAHIESLRLPNSEKNYLFPGTTNVFGPFIAFDQLAPFGSVSHNEGAWNHIGPNPSGSFNQNLAPGDGILVFGPQFWSQWSPTFYTGLPISSTPMFASVADVNGWGGWVNGATPISGETQSWVASGSYSGSGSFNHWLLIFNLSTIPVLT